MISKANLIPPELYVWMVRQRSRINDVDSTVRRQQKQMPFWSQVPVETSLVLELTAGCLSSTSNRAFPNVFCVLGASPGAYCVGISHMSSGDCVLCQPFQVPWGKIGPSSSWSRLEVDSHKIGSTRERWQRTSSVIRSPVIEKRRGILKIGHFNIINKL